MYSLAVLAIASFFLSLFLTPLVRNLARHWNLVDQPDHNRKVHESPIPRVGGVAILASYLLAFAALFILKLSARSIIWEAIPQAMQLVPAALVMFAVGLWDDLRGLRPWQKLAGEIAAALLAIQAGVHVHGIQGHQILNEWWSIPITLLWLLICTNAVNLIDGVDGLAAGVGLFATFTSLLAGLLQNNIALALATVPLAGALLGFLRYNFNPATIFLGDSGSLVIGFLLGCFGVFWSQKAATILGMTAPLMALSIPLLDTALSIARRFLRHKPIFGADRGHIHHRLLDRGLTPRKVALLLYAFCALGAVGSLIAVSTTNLSGYVVIIFCFVTWIGIQHLGYVEFGTAGRMFMEGAFRRVLNAQISLQAYEQRLQEASTVEDCWKVVEEATREFGFHRVTMRLGGQTFNYVNGLQLGNSWEVHIPITADDGIELTRTFGDSSHSVVGPLADTLRRTLRPKAPVFAAAAQARATAKVRAAMG